MKAGKEEIAGNAMKQFQDKYLIDRLSPVRSAIVTGSPICDNQENILDAVVKKIAMLGIQSFRMDWSDNESNSAAINDDLKNPHNIDTGIEAAFSEFPETDILVLGHSITDLKWFEDYDYSEYDLMIDNNLLSHMKLCNAFIRKTIDKPYKKYIVIVGSMAYASVLNGSIPYMISKAGIATLVKGLSWELAPKNYNVIGIHPSNTQDTPMTQATIDNIMKFRNVDLETATAYWSAVCPKGRFLTKTELANFVEFFISGKCDYLSGANIEFRGGQR